MATLYVTEISLVGYDSTGSPVLAPMMPPVNEQTIPISAGSSAGSIFKNNTRFVMIHTDSICCIAFGANPTAVTTAHRLAANETRFYTVTTGITVAVIAST